MSEILNNARRKISFDVLKLSHILWDGEERFNHFMKFQDMVQNDPILRYDPKLMGSSREEIYEVFCKKTKRLLEVASFEDISEFAQHTFSESLVSSLNIMMFMPTIKNLGTEEQMKLFYEPAKRFEIRGCYAQTELSHGSDINAFQTTADFDKSTQEFVMNTPNLGSTKWWGSDLGKSSNYAVVQAKLMIDGKSWGIQNFVVQIRDMITHLPLSGIQLGDIGPKFGFNLKDNGFMILDNVRIPLVNMLSKYTQVLPDGTVVKTGNDKIWLATMMLQRQHFLDLSWKVLGKALTIIIRYSLQRTQFKDKQGNNIPIFNYQSQQAIIIPMIAEMYANKFGSKRVLQIADQNLNLIKNQNDFSLMLELHVILSAAKAFYTWNTFFGLERIRQCAGGHGYSIYSGLTIIFTEFSACVAAEGDNTVLALSCGKALLSYMNKSLKIGKAPNQTVDYMHDIFDYLSNIKQYVHSKQDLYDPIILLEILKYNVAFNVATAGQKLQELMGQGLSFKEASDKHMGNILVEAARSQNNYWTMKTFIEELNILNEQDKQLHFVLNRVCILYGIIKIMEQQTQIFEYEILGSQQFKWVKQVRDELLLQLKDEALGLAEAIAYNNNSLMSAIGRDDGKIYETLLQWAQENPINSPEFQNNLFQKMKQQRGLIQEPKF